MSENENRGFGPVLANPHFRALWLAQLLAQTSQHAIHFIQMVLVEQLTGSAMQLGIVILAFSLPGVIFSPLAGVIVDRFSKKTVLVASNVSRAVLVSSYIIVLTTLDGTWELLAIYTLTFVTASLAQFFSPAEASTIPLLVGVDRLMAANSLFSLTMAISQVLGLMVLGPLSVSLIRVEGGFVLIAAMYVVAAILVATLPRDRRSAPPSPKDVSGPHRLWREFSEGWEFVSRQHKTKVAVIQLVTITTLVMVMAMIAPGYAARVLGMTAESAVIVFAPAGIGMMFATGLVGRWGHRLRRAGIGQLAIAVAGVAFGLMGFLSLDYQRLLQPILAVYPKAAFSLTSATMALGFVLGFCLSGANILAQTTLQKESPAHLRGRVFSVQFMLNNLLGIPPMLALGSAADAIGIPRVLEIVGGIAIVMAAVSMVVSRNDGGLGRVTRLHKTPVDPELAENVEDADEAR